MIYLAGAIRKQLMQLSNRTDRVLEYLVSFLFPSIIHPTNLVDELNVGHPVCFFFTCEFV